MYKYLGSLELLQEMWEFDPTGFTVDELDETTMGYPLWSKVVSVHLPGYGEVEVAVVQNTPATYVVLQKDDVWSQKGRELGDAQPASMSVTEALQGGLLSWKEKRTAELEESLVSSPPWDPEEMKSFTILVKDMTKIGGYTHTMQATYLEAVKKLRDMEDALFLQEKGNVLIYSEVSTLEGVYRSGPFGSWRWMPS